jgi:PmbA protein
MTDANRIALAIELEAKVLGGDARITGVRTASFGDGSSESVIVSSTGIRVAGRHSHTAMSVQAMAGSGDDTSTGYGYDGGRDVSAIDVDAIAAEAVDRAVTMLGATKPDSAKVAAVFEPRKTASLLGIVGGMLSGDRKFRGRTPFADRLDEVIASPLLTLVDDPTDARSLSADSHDGEGLATRANTLIDRGRLARFLYDTVTARRAGTVSTSSAVRSARSTPGVGVQALIMHPGSGSLDDLVAGVDRGVFVYALQGLHSGVNAVSGDFSVGVEGRMIRKGQLAEPIREATIASTLPRLLLDISAVADDREWLTSGDGLCSMVIDGVSLGGT